MSEDLRSFFDSHVEELLILTNLMQEIKGKFRRPAKNQKGTLASVGPRVPSTIHSSIYLDGLSPIPRDTSTSSSRVESNRHVEPIRIVTLVKVIFSFRV